MTRPSVLGSAVVGGLLLDCEPLGLVESPRAGVVVPHVEPQTPGAVLGEREFLDVANDRSAEALALVGYDQSEELGAAGICAQTREDDVADRCTALRLLDDHVLEVVVTE